MKKKWMIASALLALSLPVTIQAEDESTSDADLIINNAQLRLLGEGIDRIIELQLDTLTGNRGAASVARCCNGQQDSAAASTSFFGDTGEQKSQVDGDSGSASANARNKLRGKINTARATNDGASRSVLSWKGKVKWDVSAPLELNPEPENKEAIKPLQQNNVPLPLPDLVSAAFLQVDYNILENSLLIESDGQGLFSMTVDWNDTRSFEGSAAFDLAEGPGGTHFTGDLAAFSDQFSSSGGSLLAENFFVTGQALIPIDFDALFAAGSVTDNLFTGSLEADFSGEMRAQARGITSSVPEPGTLSLAFTGLLALMGLCRNKPLGKRIQRH